MSIAESAVDHLGRRADALAARRKPPPLEAAEAAFDDCARTIAEVRDEGLTLSLPVEAAERLFTLGFALEQLRRDLRDLDRCVSETARRRSVPRRRPRGAASEAARSSGL